MRMEEPHAGIVATTITTPVVVVQFPDVWGRNISPFGLKLEAWLRLADIPYTVQPSTELGKAPKGKLPYIRDDGRTIGDTTLIIEHLKATRGIDPDAGLTPRERAEALALQRLLEEHLYFALLYSRWIDEAGWAVLEPVLFGRVPLPARRLVARHYRRRILRTLQLQGLGRHRSEEIYAMAQADLQALADFLGERPFLMGEQLTTIDAVAYGFLGNILYVPFETELKRIAEGFPSLVAYCEAMEVGLKGED
ncbi:glutathione S-transferase family protein [Benzoatithermus flavus]|uniref:Glutathione S-transferase family protein n=1 Tax=Benzoatithermus flavus TaxID=3108223 RepID=A0ABU8XM29_9PROT